MGLGSQTSGIDIRDQSGTPAPYIRDLAEPYVRDLSGFSAPHIRDLSGLLLPISETCLGSSSPYQRPVWVLYLHQTCCGLYQGCPGPTSQPCCGLNQSCPGPTSEPCCSLYQGCLGPILETCLGPTSQPCCGLYQSCPGAPLTAAGVAPARLSEPLMKPLSARHLRGHAGWTAPIKCARSPPVATRRHISHNLPY